MDKLNHECLEHIFRYCGPKDWLILSEVCKSWRYIISKFWKQIERIEFVPTNYNKNQPFLSTKKLIAILAQIGDNITEITIISRKIGNIRLGKFVYNLHGLDLAVFWNAFDLYCTGRIKQATFYADICFANSIMRTNPGLKKVILMMDAKCDSWSFFGGQVEELELTRTRYCKVPCDEIVMLFPNLKKLTVNFIITLGNEVELNDLFVSLYRRPTLEEFNLQVNYMARPQNLIVDIRYCEEMLKTSKNLRVLDWRGVGVDKCFEMILSLTPNLEKFNVEILHDLKLKGYFKISQDVFSELKSLTMKFKPSQTKCYFFENKTNVIELSKLIQKMPSLLNLEFLVFNHSYCYFTEIENANDTIWHAVNMAILYERKVLINDDLEIVKMGTVEHDDSEILAIRINSNMNASRNLQVFLERAFQNCEFISIL